MKRVYFFGLILFSFTCYAQTFKLGKKFIISGTLIGQDTGIVVLNYSDASGKFIHDTSSLDKGYFKFSGFINEPTSAYLDGNIKSKSINDPNTTDFFIEPTEMQITLSVDDFKHAIISGSRIQEEMEVLKKQKDSLYKRMGIKKCETAYGEIIEKLKKDKENRELQDESKMAFNNLNPFREFVMGMDNQFIINHPNSYLSPYLLRYYFATISADSLKMVYNRFSYNVQNSGFGKLVQKQIMKKSGVVESNDAKSFQARDIKGKVVDLSSFKNQRYVLLDFWASWCIPCRRGNPYLKALYNKYHSKGLEIISISSDTKREDWKKAIARDGIGSWRHILSGVAQKNFNQNVADDNDINVKYVIGVLPTKIIVDKNGLIIFRGEGERDLTIDKKLTEIFGF